MSYNYLMKITKKNIEKYFRKNNIMLIVALFVVILPIGFFIINNQKSPSEAEIRFAEKSDDSKIEGKVLPASCNSTWTDKIIINYPEHNDNVGCSCNLNTEQWLVTNVYRCDAGCDYSPSSFLARCRDTRLIWTTNSNLNCSGIGTRVSSQLPACVPKNPAVGIQFNAGNSAQTPPLNSSGSVQGTPFNPSPNPTIVTSGGGEK